MLPAFGLVAALYWVTVAFVIVVDPLNIYSWGVASHLEEVDYGPLQTPRLVDVVAKDASLDTVMIGSSSAAFFTPSQIKITGGTHRAINLSYPGSLPSDRQIVLTEMLNYSKAKRILLEFSWAYLLPIELPRDQFPYYLYTGNAFGKLRGVTIESIRQAIEAVRSGGLIRSRGYDLFQLGTELDQAQFLAPSGQTRLAETIMKFRPDIGKQTTARCDSFPAITTQFVPFAREAARRGITLDIYFPPLSLAAYYELQTGDSRLILGDSIMNDILLSHRCLVDMLDGEPNIRIFAFDNEDWITSNLKNYMDPSHPMNVHVLDFMMREIGRGGHRLRKSNVVAYTDELRQRILSYGDEVTRHGSTQWPRQPTNSMH